MLVTVDLEKTPGWSAEERSDELAELARSAGVKIAESGIVRRHTPTSDLFIGKGKAFEIAASCAGGKIDTVIFNNDLSATQTNNLEKIIKAKVIDRTRLILDIFARRAHSNEGKLQVELAQLLYLMPRLTGKGTQLSRLGGGIGTRGPGEQKLEVDRRVIRSRICKLEKELEDLRKRRGMMREKRKSFALLTAAIVGYTNAGKSTLLNALTQSRVFVEDRLFATLDPTARGVTLPNRQKILLVDTVGFLSDLPHHLIDAFHATLEEVAQADLLLHVVDASHAKAMEQSRSVYKVLETIGAKDKPMITLLNKIDKIDDPARIDGMKTYFTGAIPISAAKHLGFKEMIDILTVQTANLTARVEITLPLEDNKTLNMLYENGLVMNKVYKEDKVHVEAVVPLRMKEALEKEFT